MAGACLLALSIAGCNSGGGSDSSSSSVPDSGSNSGNQSGNGSNSGNQPSPETPTAPDSSSITVNLNGSVPEGAVVTASGNGELHTATLHGSQLLSSAALRSEGYTFNGLTPDIDYSIKVQAPGYSQDKVVTHKPGEDVSISLSAQPTPDVDGEFRYNWKDDGQSVSGLEYASKVNTPLTVEVEGLEHEVPNIAAAQMLYRDYRVILDDTGDLAWTQAHAYRLLETLRQIPQQHCSLRPSTGSLPCDTRHKSVHKTIWKLSNRPVTDDVQTEGNTVTLDTQTFTYADPKIANVDGRRGRFFSKRLHHAVVRQLTNNGKDLEKANYILEERFGVTIDTRKNNNRSNLSQVYRDIAVIDVDRDSSSWQSFTPEEVLMVINQLEEMPTGMHIIRGGDNNEEGLKYLFRRANGHNHPLYPEAPAVAWPSAGYIEFMEGAFKGSNLEHMQRLILHEKTHFLWHFNISREQKLQWLSLSDWYRVDGSEESYLNEPPYSSEKNGASHTHGSIFDLNHSHIHVDASDGWSARKTTNFVSAYAQLKNPNEDLAESVSYFLMNPDLLRSKAPGKYEFIRDNLMAGVMYLQEIREDLTFEVLNLHPDYIYPGKIKEVDISVVGEADEEKQVTVDLKLHTTKSSCSKESCLEGASVASTRLFSEVGTFINVRFYPANGRRISDHLRATFTLPETAKNGWWSPAQIKITDPLGNERYQRSTDYGWQLFINNPGEDITPPEYIQDSLKLSLGSPKAVRITNGQLGQEYGKESCDSSDRNCRVIRTITARWDVDEDVAMRDSNACFSRFAHQSYDTYSVDQYGEFEENPEGIIDGQCQTQIIATEYYRTGEYKVAHINLRDRALNQNATHFADNHHSLEVSPKVNLTDSSNPDGQPPEMSIQPCSDGVERCISIKGTPSNPSNPDGETNVELTYWAKDNKSGLDTVTYNLRDPQGKNHFYYAHHDNTHTVFFVGDPTVWNKYTAEVTLPKGSAPGTWGLTEMTLFDKAGNKKAYDFTETVMFETLKN